MTKAKTTRAGRITGKPGSALDSAGKWAKSHALIAYWLPVLLYAAGIFTLSSLSKPPAPPGAAEIPDFAEAVHFIEYAFFGFLLFTAYNSTASEPIKGRAFALALATAFIYAATDEYHQSFVPGRQCTLGDFTVDCAGATAAMIAVLLFRLRREYKP